jgi:hypothetical protein
MGFQFPSITRMASSTTAMQLSQRHDRSTTATAATSANDDITLLWGVNVIASVVGTVLTAISSMVIGFSANLLVGLGLYLGALMSALAAARITQKARSSQEVVR